MQELDKRELIASLPGHLGYQALLEELNNLVQESVSDVVRAETEEKTLKAARTLQALFKYFHILSTTPQQIAAEFEEERRLILEAGDDPIFSPQRRQLLNTIEKVYEPSTGQPKKRK